MDEFFTFVGNHPFLVGTFVVLLVLFIRNEMQRGGATVIKIDLDRLRQLVSDQPDATTRELHQRLGIDCSVSAVDMALRRAGLSFKKRRSMPPSKTGPMSSSVEPRGSDNNPPATPAA